MQLVSLGGGAGFLKAGILGFAGSGKTYTSAVIAAGVRKAQGLKGPIAMFDTEAAAQYIAPMVKRDTGLDLVGAQSRALKDAIEFLKACQAQGVSVAILDSVTHLWRELQDSYLKQVNTALAAKGRNPRTRLEFQDWGPIKAEWEKFANLYLNIPMHVIICGRAGYDYDYEDVEGRDDGKKQLVKTGIKMKTEGEFGYEPSLLIQMERVQQAADGSILPYIVHRATVIKDRFGVLDGKSADNPGFDFFRPFVDLLTPGQAVSVDTTAKTDLHVDESGDAEWQRERKLRAIFCEEIQGKLTAVWPGQSAEEKKNKVEVIHRLFGTRSWTQVEGLRSEVLKGGLDAMDAVVETLKKPGEEAPAKEEPKKLADALPVAGEGAKKARRAEAVAK